MGSVVVVGVVLYRGLGVWPVFGSKLVTKIAFSIISVRE